MTDSNQAPDSENPTQPLPTPAEQTEQTEQKGTDQASMTDTNALTPIRGSNGYQQQIAIDASKPLELSVTNASGKVRITTSDQPNVWVVVRRTDGRVDEEEVQITVTVDGNRISIRPSWQVASGLGGIAKKIKDQLQNGLNNNDWKLDNFKISPDLNYDIRVEVPKALVEGSRFNLKTASGKIEAHGLRDTVSIASASGKIESSDLDGRISMHTASGSIHAQQVVGSLEANSASGSITVEDGEAWLALRAISGSIKIDRFTMKNARITTVSGSVKAAAIANNVSDYSFETVSGSLGLNVILPGDANATLNFKSLSGSAKVNGAWTSDGKRAWHAGNATQRSEGPTIRVKTVSGSLTISGHVEASIPTRHEALPAAIESGEWASEAQDTEAFNLEGIPPIPPVPPVPPVPDAPWNNSAKDRTNDPTQPIFTPPADWPNWIKSTARVAEGTARHVVNSFQQPVEPLHTTSSQAHDVLRGHPAADTHDQEQARRDREQALRDAEQAQRDQEQARRDAEQAQRDHEQALREVEQIRREDEQTQREDAQTERDDAPFMAEAADVAEADTSVPGDTQPEPVATESTHDLGDQDEAERLRILEALERGEIDIDEALSKIERS